jgi:hypothetical protein
MKKVDLWQAIGALANIGVIAGIAFLAIELQQNNRLLSAEARYDQRQNQQARASRAIVNNELADLMVRARDGADLSESDELRLFLMSADIFSEFEWTYSQIQAGNLEDDGTLLPQMRNAFGNPRILFIPGDIFREAWDTLSPTRNPDFVRYVEANVLERAE